ncbi:type II secretion system protein [Bdellovibrio sp. HCB337]|uniref:type II secretion system protein n=1 Tax=Bdellovibrio sp. HCB337 TaxID=3394358 RepID=UPI0039A50271
MKRINSQSGFSMIMALMAIAIVGALSMAMMTIFRTFNAQSRHFNSMVGARALLSTMQGIVAYPNLCMANLHPGSRHIDPVQAATEAGVPLRILMGGGPSGPIVQAGAELRSYDVTIDALTFRNVHPIGTDPGTPGNTLYSGELVVKLKKLGVSTEVSGGNELRERSVGTMTVSVNPASSNITGCYALTDARTSCIEVGGTYDDTSYPKCKMPYPCDGIDGAIFLGYTDTEPKTPICRTMEQVVGTICPAGQYIVSNGAGSITCKSP